MQGEWACYPVQLSTFYLLNFFNCFFLTKGNNQPAEHWHKNDLLSRCPLQPLSCGCWFSWSKPLVILFILAPVPRSEPLLQSSCVLGFGDPEKKSLGWLCVSEGPRQEEHSTTNAALHLWSWPMQPCADQNMVSSVNKSDSAYETNCYTERVGLEHCVDKS